MRIPIKFDDSKIYELNSYSDIDRGSLICVHTSDLHFGALDPKYQYDVLKDQFIDKIKGVNFDILTINGDLFEHKYMSNSDVTMYATLFIRDCIEICIEKDATMIILEGTKEHDAGQLKLFYQYLDSAVDLRIVETLKFEYVKGIKILCIPEEYGKGEDYYNNFLLRSGPYDLALLHGTFRGAIYQDIPGTLDSKREPTFRIEDFRNCTGCMISGHVHTPGCYEGYYYYCGSPLRWRFGEEHDKGFLISLHNLNDGSHYVHFEKIISMRYDTININDLISSPPNEIIDYITQLKEKEGIDNIRLEITEIPNTEATATLDIIKKYYRNNNSIKVNDTIKKESILKENKQLYEEYKEYEYIFDNSLSKYDILSRYINDKKGYMYVTSEDIIGLMEDEI